MIRRMTFRTALRCIAAGGMALAVSACGGEDSDATGDGAAFQPTALRVTARDCEKQRECWGDARYQDYYDGETSCEDYRAELVEMQVATFQLAPDPAACESAWLDYLDCWHTLLDESPCDALYCDDPDAAGCRELECDGLLDAADIACGTSGV